MAYDLSDRGSGVCIAAEQIPPLNRGKRQRIAYDSSDRGSGVCIAAKLINLLNQVHLDFLRQTLKQVVCSYPRRDSGYQALMN